MEHVTFSGRYALDKNQPVIYITERCVFTLTDDGMKLTEISPGVDLEKDILSQMDFKPLVDEQPQLMVERIFRTAPMDLKADLLTLTLEERLTYDPAENLFFVNFEGFTVQSSQDVQAVKEAVEQLVSPLDKKVYTIVNYDNFTIMPDMVKQLVDHYYSGVTRYTTSTFLRMKLGDALQKRDVAPHIYESSAEAQQALKKE